MKKFLTSATLALGLLGATLFPSTSAFAGVTSVPTTGGNYTFSWSAGLGFSSDTFEITAPSASTVNIKIDDCCVPGDTFAYWLDGIKQSWSSDGFVSSLYTASANNVFLSTGTHAFKIEVTGLAPGYTSGGAYIKFSPLTAAVPEPETYAMLLAGLGLLGHIARRRKQG